MAAPVTVACHFPLGYFFLLARPSRWLPPFFFPPPHPPPDVCTYAPRREDYSSSPIPLQRAICEESRGARLKDSLDHSRSRIPDRRRSFCLSSSPDGDPRSFTRFPFIRREVSCAKKSRETGYYVVLIANKQVVIL